MATAINETLIASLRSEIEDLKSRLNESEETLKAIRNGEVDAIVVSGEHGEKIFSLTSSETPYRKIIEEMDEGAVTVSSEGIILYSNQRFAGMISQPLTRITGTPFSNWISELDTGIFRKLISKGSDKKVRGIVSVPVDDKVLFLQLSVMPLPDNIEGDICILVSDITEIRMYQNYLIEMVEERTSELKEANKQLFADIEKLQKTEKALQLSEERYSLAMNAALIGSWEYVYRGRMKEINWSEQMYRLYGLEPGTRLTSSLILNLLHHDDRERVKTVFIQAVENHTQIDCEYRIISQDASVHWIHSAGNVIYTGGPDSFLRVTGISHEITKRKKAETRLRDSEERYRLLSDTMMQGVIYHDSEGKILSINPAGERILGKDASELIGQKTGYELYHEDGKLVDDSHQPCIIALHSGHYSINQVFKIHNSRDKSFHWISIDTLPLFRKNEDAPYQVYSVFEDITERRNAEREILRREQLFRSAFDEGAVPMSITSKEGVYLKVNHAFCKLTGYPEEELRGMTFQHLTYPDDLGESIRGRQQLEEGERTSFRLEKRYIRKDGKIVWVSISTAPVKDENGNWDFFVTHIQDINKRKLAENRLRESKERFKQLANSIPQLSWIARADGYIFWFNHRWYDYTGTTPEKVTGWGWLDVHNPDVLPSAISQWKEFIAAGKPFEMINSLLGKDGKYRDFLTKSIPIMDKNGQVEQWFGTHTDISELKKAESELEKSRERLNIALENGRIGLWEWDLVSGNVIWDMRMERIFGYEPGKFPGNYAAFENSVHEEDIPHVRKAISECIENGTPFETIYRTKPRNNESNYISAKAFIVKDNEGKPLSMSGVCFDVTDMQKGTEQALFRLNEDLLRSNTDLQQFAYVASHDLQEPLRMISSFTQLLQLKYHDKLDADGREYIRYAVEGSKRMYALINGLLTYSRVQTRSREFQEVDMNNVVKKVRENLSLAIEETHTIINCDNLPTILADEYQMIQLIQNLMENSIKFRNGTPDISLSYKVSGNMYIFSFSDKGIGIEPQYFDRIFRIFQRLHRIDEYEGTGIGLAVCKRIVERHGGTISVDSVPGSGSTFSFSIPVSLSQNVVK
jgi:PAS domain S-box-containing protein